MGNEFSDLEEPLRRDGYAISSSFQQHVEMESQTYSILKNCKLKKMDKMLTFWLFKHFHS